VAELLGQVKNPGAPAIGIWSVAETAAHLSHSSPSFLDAARGTAVELEDLSDNAASSVRDVAADPERDLGVLAARIEQGERSLATYARSVQGDPTVTPFQWVEVPLSAMLGIELAELLVHGHDIAHASQLPWPIDPYDAEIALRGVVAMVPHMVDARRAARLNMSCEIRVRSGFRAVVTVDDGHARTVFSGRPDVDCRLSVEPAAFLLLSYNRVGRLRPALTGKVVPWGRRPWLVLRLLSAVTSV
jgi:Mycothiol maleylpyruvate isomerase N-terminal domain